MNLSQKQTDWSVIETLLGRHNGIETQNRLSRLCIDDVVFPAKEGKASEEGLGKTLESLETVRGFMDISPEEAAGMAEGFRDLGLGFLNEHSALADLCPFYMLLSASFGPEGSVEAAYGRALEYYRELKAEAKERRRRRRMFNFDAKSFEDAMAMCGNTDREKEEARSMAEELNKKLKGKNPAGMERGAFIEAANGALIDTVMDNPERYPVFIRFEELYGRFMDQLMVSRNLMEV